MKLIAAGNFGMSMEWRRPVTEVIGERLWLTVVVSVAALLLTWALTLPIGIYSAVRQYSVSDYVATFIGFIGLAVPNFLLALVLLYLGFTLFNANIGGLFSQELQDAPWSQAKVWDLLKHLPIPALILGLAGTAQRSGVSPARACPVTCGTSARAAPRPRRRGDGTAARSTAWPSVRTSSWMTTRDTLRARNPIGREPPGIWHLIGCRRVISALQCFQAPPAS